MHIGTLVITVVMVWLCSIQNKKLPFPKKRVCEPGNRVPNLASARHSAVFQAVAGCPGAHFPFYLVIGQKRIEFVLALRRVSGIFSGLPSTLLISK